MWSLYSSEANIEFNFINLAYINIMPYNKSYIIIHKIVYMCMDWKLLDELEYNSF